MFRVFEESSSLESVRENHMQALGKGGSGQSERVYIRLPRVLLLGGSWGGPVINVSSVDKRNLCPLLPLFSWS